MPASCSPRSPTAWARLPGARTASLTRTRATRREVAYAGLRAGEGLELSDPTGLVVQPAAADAQLEAERGEKHVDAGGEPPGGWPSSDRNGEDGEVPPRAVRRFHGSVSLDPTRLSREAGDVAEAVVAHLNGLLDATVEVHADIPGGAPDHVVRTVTENAATLRFDPGAGFEAE